MLLARQPGSRKPAGSAGARIVDSAPRSAASPKKGPTLLRRITRRYRWLLLASPVYALLAHGPSGWPLAAVLGMAAITYNVIVAMAQRRWPEWALKRALYLRCAEIGLVCVALSLIYVHEDSVLRQSIYYDGFYAVFVALAGASAGRRGVFWSASVAALAVAVGQVMLVPALPVIFTLAGIEYWVGVALYSGTFGIFFLAIGLLAYLAADFEAHRQKLRTLSRLGRHFQALSDAVLILTPKGNIADANPAATRIFGASVSALKGRRLHDLIRFSQFQDDVDSTPIPLKTDRPLLVSAWRASGEEFPAEVTMSPYRLANGNGRATVAVVRDLSDRQRIIEIAAHRERLATMGEVTAQIMHDLSNPLSGIASIVEELQTTLGEREQESLELIRDEAERAAGMIRELLYFTRRNTPDTTVSLNDVVRRALKLCALRHRSDRIEIVTDLSPEAAFLCGGSGRLEQVVLNLLDNARHAVAARGAGRITVRTRVNGERVLLEVSDTGMGIAADVLDRIFEPFFTTKSPGLGTGLGLTIVERIVRDCGGHISVESKPGHGTTFSLSFERAA